MLLSRRIQQSGPSYPLASLSYSMYQSLSWPLSGTTYPLNHTWSLRKSWLQLLAIKELLSEGMAAWFSFHKALILLWSMFGSYTALDNFLTTFPLLCIHQQFMFILLLFVGGLVWWVFFLIYISLFKRYHPLNRGNCYEILSAYLKIFSITSLKTFLLYKQNYCTCALLWQLMKALHHLQHSWEWPEKNGDRCFQNSSRKELISTKGFRILKWDLGRYRCQR